MSMVISELLVIKPMIMAYMRNKKPIKDLTEQTLKLFYWKDHLYKENKPEDLEKWKYINEYTTL